MGRRDVFRLSLAAVAIGSAFGAASPAAARDQTIAVTGTQAPGLPAGVTFSGFGASNVMLNNTGQVAFQAFLAGSGVDSTNNSAIYRDATPIVRTGDAAAGLPSGVTFSQFFISAFAERFNDAGQVAFEATLTGTGVDSSNSKAIYRNTSLVARTGDAAPGTSGANFSSLSATPNINNAGQVLFHAFFTGPSVDFSNDRALYRDATIIARSGDPAPAFRAPLLPPRSRPTTTTWGTWRSPPSSPASI